MARLKKVKVIAVIEFYQKEDESDDEMLNIVKVAIENYVGPVNHIEKSGEQE